MGIMNAGVCYTEIKVMECWLIKTLLSYFCFLSSIVCIRIIMLQRRGEVFDIMRFGDNMRFLIFLL